MMVAQQVAMKSAVLLMTLLLWGAVDCKPQDMETSSDAGSNSSLVIRPRSSWSARKAKAVNPLRVNPVPFVVVHHTYLPAGCATSGQCEEAMRSMQRSHQDVRGWLDIGYSFAIGGDGLVYEGRGWDTDGAHAPRYNDKSVGLAFIGDYRTTLPSAAMLRAARDLISLGVSLGKIRTDHVVVGHRQTRDTECPGQALFDHIATWPDFSPTVPANPQEFEDFLETRRQASNE